MDYGNSGGAEFNWNYSMGGNGGGGSAPMYTQMGQMNPAGYGGGQQWLHSNQNHGNSPNYQMPMSQGATNSPFDDYNQSMMRYTNMPKADGKSDMYGSGMEHDSTMGMNSMGHSYGGYPSTMTRNGLGNPGAGMGQGGGSAGFGGSSW
ncbi:hypothetical protein KR222_003889 [Zaprionus bogoriensis]|nr:hypothetical protein KR222_003889 [Zaprionus bogoriensis]